MAKEHKSRLQRFIIWREKNLKEKQFILILSFLVGIFTAFAALILKMLIHWIQNFLTENFDTTEANYLYLVYPVVGIFLAGLFVRYVVKDDISHGVTKILYAISRRQGRIKRHNTWSSIIASSITIGFGGSVGAEAPIVLTGSAIGSDLGSVFKMEHRTLMLLVGCGAAGAVAGIFKAPIAGLVFTLEVLMIDLTMSSLLPLLISAVTAATVSYVVTGQEAMFKFHLDQPFELGRIPYVIMLGIFCGLVSLYFTRAMNSVEGVFGRLKKPYKKLMVGGAIEKPRRIDVYGSQQDIAATLLAQLGLPHGEFVFSKDLMNPASPHFAFFTVPDAFGVATADNHLIFDNQSGKVVLDEGEHKGANLRAGEAYLQKLYDDLATR